MPRPFAALAALACAVALSGCVTATPLTEHGRPTFAGRTVVVTGASSGFGRGIALAMGARGASVVLAARRADQLERVAAQIRSSGGQALVAPTDVGDPAAVARLAGAAVAAFGHVDVWVNDAGVASLGRFEAVPVADHARIIDVNLKGVIYGSHAALTLFTRQGSGVLINMGSTESHVPLPYQASYVASKFAVLGLDSAIAEELRLEHRTGVHVVTVEPWAADTPFWNQMGNYTGRRPRMILLDAPDKIVEAVLWAVQHPGRQEIAVGWKAKGAIAGERLAPRTAERFAGAVFERVMEQAPAGAPSGPGDVYAPDARRDPARTGVSGGVRERMRAEDADKSAPASTAPL